MDILQRKVVLHPLLAVGKIYIKFKKSSAQDILSNSIISTIISNCRCDNKESCDLTATHAFFKKADPCNGVPKKLQVEYECKATTTGMTNS